MEGLQHFFDVIQLENLQMRAEHWLLTEVLVWTSLAQIGAVLLALVMAWLATTGLHRLVGHLPIEQHIPASIRSPVVSIARSLTLPLVAFLFVKMAGLALTRNGLPDALLVTVGSLLAAWIVIRLTASLISNPTVSRLIAGAAWSIAALNIVGLLGPTVDLLESLALTVGQLRISLLDLIKGAIMVAVLLWVASLLARVAEKRIGVVASLTPSARVLISKLLRFALLTGAILIGLNSVGIDLTGLAVFTGAIGLGIGFGLQTVFSNLISGVILLMDRSVKPGDTIAIGSTFGWINSLNARYVSLITRDGTEHLVPNEELIRQKVENWSHSNPEIRLKLPFGVSYDSDPRQVIEVAAKAAAKVDRVLVNPGPVCRLMQFGDSSVDFEIRIWIRDPQRGVANVCSDVLLSLWDDLKAAGIEFPFPQRDLRIKELPQITVKHG